MATGTLSDLVFYANIVGPNCTIFLPVESTNALSVFIAWLNLDFGIEACFYDGMTAYAKTWLQLVFPVYIWVLVGIMILISHFSHAPYKAKHRYWPGLLLVLRFVLLLVFAFNHQ